MLHLCAAQRERVMDGSWYWTPKAKVVGPSQTSLYQWLVLCHVFCACTLVSFLKTNHKVFIIYLYLPCLYVPTYVWLCKLWFALGEWRTTWGIQFSPSSMWVLGLEHSAFTHGDTLPALWAPWMSFVKPTSLISRLVEPQRPICEVFGWMGLF